jgi:oligoendopeptidase F
MAPQDQWNLTSLYPNDQAWEQELQALTAGKNETDTFPQLVGFKQRLHTGPHLIKEVLDLYFYLSRRLDRLYTYAHLKHDEDLSNSTYKGYYERAMGLYTTFGQESSWINPELLTLPREILENYIQTPPLNCYSLYLQQILHMQPHTLSAQMEELIAMSSNALYTPSKAFSALNNADVSFGEIHDYQGVAHPLSHATYQVYLQSPDRTLRKNSFLAISQYYQKHQNTLAELIVGQLHAHTFISHSHNYPDTLTASLHPKNISPSVYHSLLSATEKALPQLQEYLKLRKKILKLDELHFYDLYLPLIGECKVTIPYEEAVNLVIESVAPLGEEYQSILRRGLIEEGWVDRYENQGKRSGAYSSGCYDSHPYILMNYAGTLNDLFTLAHEAGHSMHSYYSKKKQPYHTSGYVIFVAEVASTLNEDLLHAHLVKRYKDDPRMQLYLLNHKLEEIRSTFFRQAMFAEFELFLHSQIEQHQPLPAATINQAYAELYRKYFGDTLTLDPEVEIEWSRIPHFYYQYYVYQYATGITAALALSQNILKRDAEAVSKYLNFLSSGGSKYPLNLLHEAGCDLLDPSSIQGTIETFSKTLTEFEKLWNTL